MATTSRIRVEGEVAAGFEPVRDVFAENFTRRHELGGACCVYLHGEKVVDLWGGVRNKATGDPWQEDTMAIVYSATKGMAAMTLAIAHARGWLDYDEHIATYWPEFAQNGKERITVRQLLAHQAGLYALDERVDRDTIADLDRLAVVLARQEPAWPPGTRQGYHAITLGFYQNEILRRVDPQHRSLGQFFHDEIAAPLGIEFYIRLPQAVPNDRLAVMVPPSVVERVRGFPWKLAVAALSPRSKIRRALRGSELPLDTVRIYARNLEVPSGGGVGTARAIARAYGDFATGGHALHLGPETMAELEAPAVPAGRGFYDECMLADDVRFSLGFMKSGELIAFGSERAYGAPGAGGAMGFADPVTGVGYGYVTCGMGATLTGDPRDVALRQALNTVLAQMPVLRPTKPELVAAT